MIELKEGEGDPHKDLHFWRWALKVIKRYEAGGMSSDESDNEAVAGQAPVYRVKVMVWRRRIDDLLKVFGRDIVQRTYLIQGPAYECNAVLDNNVALIMLPLHS